MIVVNGQVLAQAKQFDTASVQVITATVDLDDIRSYRASIPSFGIQATAAASSCSSHKFISCNDTLTSGAGGITTTVPQSSLFLHSPEEECCLGPACWLWDYLRRSGAAGFLLPLSGMYYNILRFYFAHTVSFVITIIVFIPFFPSFCRWR